MHVNIERNEFGQLARDLEHSYVMGTMKGQILVMETMNGSDQLEYYDYFSSIFRFI